MFAATRQFFNRHVQDWARRRQGPDGENVCLERRRIYILPTRQGWLYGFATFVMLLGSMNYSNSMGFMLTFVLAGLGFVAMYACHANLADLQISDGGAQPVFAGETARFVLHLTNTGRAARTAISLSAVSSDTSVMGDVAAHSHGSVNVPLQTEKRGWTRLERLVVETTYPFGLFRAWSWAYMPLRVLVYPAPAVDAPLLPAPSGGFGEGHSAARGEEDFSGLRGYRPGDSPRHIAWRVSVRTQRLLTKQFSGGGMESRWLDFDAIAIANTEVRLAVLCRWILLAHAQNLDYGLRLPGREIPVGNGSLQRDRCLRALALFGTPAEDLR